MKNAVDSAKQRMAMTLDGQQSHCETAGRPAGMGIEVFFMPLVAGGTGTARFCSNACQLQKGAGPPAYFKITGLSGHDGGFSVFCKPCRDSPFASKSNFRPEWDSRLNAKRRLSPVKAGKSAKPPRVTISCAMTLDCKIACARGNLVLSDRLDWERMFRERAASHAVLVGATSASVVSHRYGSYGYGMEPVKVVLDPMLRTPPEARIFENSDSVIFHSGSAMKKRIEKFKSMPGITLVRMKGRRFAPEKILSVLGRLGIKSVLLEGGGATISLFARNGCFDRLRAFISPQISCCPGGKAVSLAHGKPFAKPVKLKLVRAQRQGIGVLAEFERD